MKKEKNSTSTKRCIEFKCDNCNIVYERYLKTHIKMINSGFYDNKDYCKKCCRSILNNRPEYKHNMSIILTKLHQNNPEIAKKISNKLKGTKVGDDNPMKRPEIAKKVSDARKKMFAENPNLKVQLSIKSANAWKCGKFNGINVGKCKWYEYLHSNGSTYKVQGTWELAFIKWMDENNLSFICHKGRIPYVSDGLEKSYYPDFYVYEWDSYVDVKSDHFYNFNQGKFDNIFICNPDLNLKILFKKDLVKLGVIIKN